VLRDQLPVADLADQNQRIEASTGCRLDGLAMDRLA
jgi:hypothetical protein